MKKWFKRSLIILAGAYVLYSVAVLAFVLPPNFVRGVHDKEVLHPLQRMKLLGISRTTLPSMLMGYNPFGWAGERYLKQLHKEGLDEIAASSPQSAPIAEFYYLLPDIVAKTISIEELTQLREKLLALPLSDDPYEVVLGFDALSFVTGDLQLRHYLLEEPQFKLGKSKREYAKTLISYSDDNLNYYSRVSVSKRTAMLKEVYSGDIKNSFSSELSDLKLYPQNYISAYKGQYISLKSLQQYRHKLKNICADMKQFYPMPEAADVLQMCFTQVEKIQSLEGENHAR